ncbi:MAG: GNAT family N-acetyltransferase [Candidatus Micrarchaeota archaeon]|nr:GNAT family N-acetyltransferase [Candidatus Micrarchaeota archaeon]
MESYDDYPFAMWFDEKPGKGEIDRIFYNKINGMHSGLLADFVAEDSGRIVGECETAKTYGDWGIVGIIVRKEYKKRGIGKRLLDESITAAKQIGIGRLGAEVMKTNVEALNFFMINGFKPVKSNTIEKSGKKHESVFLERDT